MAVARPSLAEIVNYARQRERDLLATIGSRDRAAGGEGVERMLLLVDDLEACRVAIAWSGADVGWKSPRAGLTIDRGGSWKRRPKRALMWAWTGAIFDLEAVALAAGVTRARTFRRFPILKENQLIYPDGTLSPFALQVIGTVTRRRLEANR